MTIEEKIKKLRQLKSQLAALESEISTLEAEIAAETPDAVGRFVERQNAGAVKLFNPLVQ